MNKYPGTEDVERIRCTPKYIEEEPDFVYPFAPNYEKFRGWSPEEVLVWLNID